MSNFIQDERGVVNDPLDERFRGLVLPVWKRRGGFFQVSFTREIIKSSISMILNTRLGERVMLPDFGSRLHRVVFEQNDAVLRALIVRYITDDLSRWEPRIKILDISTKLGEEVLEIYVSYEILSLSVEDAVTLVFNREDRR